MTDIVERLRAHYPSAGLPNEAADVIERLRAAIQRIDGINDNPACYNHEINEVCSTILRPGALSNPDDDAVRVLTRDDPTGRRRVT